MSSITGLYEIQFADKLFIDESVKTMSSPNKILNQFITDFRTIDDINQCLIIYIKKVIDGINLQKVLISETQITVQLSKRTANFYSEPDYSDADTPEFSIPTSDLLQIAEAWMSYISVS